MKKPSVFVRNVLNRFSEKGLLDFILLSTKRSLKKIIELDILVVTMRDLSKPVERVNTPLISQSIIEYTYAKQHT